MAVCLICSFPQATSGFGIHRWSSGELVSKNFKPTYLAYGGQKLFHLNTTLPNANNN